MIAGRALAVSLASALVASGAVAAVVVATRSSGSSARRTSGAESTSASIPPVTVDVDHDGLDDNFENRLANAYAPVLFFDAQESNFPMNVVSLTTQMQLQHREDGCAPDHTSELMSHTGNLLGPAPGRYWTFPNDFTDVGPRLNCQDDKRTSLSTVESLPDGPNGDGVGDEQNMQLFFPNGAGSVQSGNLDPKDWTTYVHVYPSRHGGVVIQYWHVFAYNSALLDNHEGDWDASLQVELDAHLQPIGAWFSRHSDDAPGRVFKWGGVTTYEHTHVEESIDAGGHGAYAGPNDWCSNPDTVNLVGLYPHLSISWPSDTDHPSPGNLRRQHCSVVGGHLTAPDSLPGGTVWFTSNANGGLVEQGGAGIARSLDRSQTQGTPLVNMGECNPGHQASQLNEGTCRPLNGQTFIQYSGQWGTTRPDPPSNFGNSPRGPVFQGFTKQLARYESWYNDGADVPYASAPPTRGAASSQGAPTHLTVVPDNGSVTVSWKPPMAGPQPTGYRVHLISYSNDRSDAPSVSPIIRSVDANTLSVVLDRLLQDCHQEYAVLVSTLTASGEGDSATSAPFRPSGIIDPSRPPPTVVILLDGISEAKPGFRMNPYAPTDIGPPSYCPEAFDTNGNRVENAFKHSPDGPFEFFSKWNYYDPSDAANGNNPIVQSNSTPRDLRTGNETHRFMLDAIAATGAMILPYSYKGATLNQTSHGIEFDFPAYNACTSTPFPPGGGIGCANGPAGSPEANGPSSESSSIGQDVQALVSEIKSVQQVWKDNPPPVVVLGHSQGGLIAFEAWKSGQLPSGVTHLFSLDSPINGVCPTGCVGPAGYPAYLARWSDDVSPLASDSGQDPPFRFVGTWGDGAHVPVLGNAYQSGDDTLQHQLLVTGKNCSDLSNDADCPDLPNGPDHISECRIPSSGWVNDDQHFIVKFCPSNVDYFNKALGLQYAATLHLGPLVGSWYQHDNALTINPDGTFVDTCTGGGAAAPCVLGTSDVSISGRLSPSATGAIGMITSSDIPGVSPGETVSLSLNAANDTLSGTIAGQVVGPYCGPKARTPGVVGGICGA